ncbi:hypothetical protein D3C72_1942270 [compost metagenome]
MARVGGACGAHDASQHVAGDARFGGGVCPRAFGGRGFAQGVAEFEVAGYVARRVGVGNVAGDGALALGTQDKCGAVEIQPVGHLF